MSGVFLVHPAPDAPGLSHAPQITSETLPYWCILPLMHKVSHTLAIGLYLPRLDECILPLMHKVSYTCCTRAIVHPSPDAQGLSHPRCSRNSSSWLWCILPLMHKVSHTTYILHLPQHICAAWSAGISCHTTTRDHRPTHGDPLHTPCS